MKCSMESHISHIFADLFTSRPKAYSQDGLRQLLKLRLLKVNGKDIKKMYLESLIAKENKATYSFEIQKTRYDYEFYDLTQKLRFLNADNLINYI